VGHLIDRARSWISRWERHIRALVLPTSAWPLERQTERIVTVMRAFYAYLFFASFTMSSSASKAWTSAAATRPQVHIELASLFPTDSWNGVRVVACALVLVGSLLLCVNPGWRWLRIVTAASLLTATAITYDIKGKIEHGHHAALWAAIGFCVLPSSPRGAAAQRRFAASFFGVQVLVMTLYTSAGICKLLGTFYDAPDGVTWFHPDALPLTISGNWERSKTTLLGSFFVQQPLLSCLSQWLAFGLELGALPAVFFRHLQRPWALALTLMHVMILHTMMIHFHQMCIIVLLVLVCSPYAPPFRETWARIRGKPAMSAPSGSPRTAPPRWSLFWGPAAALVYLLVAFGRFSPSTGAFRPEIYPISPMAMFFRQHPSEEAHRRLAQLRARLDQVGLFPERAEKSRKKSGKRKAQR